MRLGAGILGLALIVSGCSGTEPVPLAVISPTPEPTIATPPAAPGGSLEQRLAPHPVVVTSESTCQSALNFAPGSASNIDPSLSA